MKRWLLSGLLAWFGLPAAASEVISNDTAHVFKSRNVAKQIGEVADWSTPTKLPAGPRYIHLVSFCREDNARYWSGEMSCRTVRYAQGVAGSSGYIQPIDLEKFGEERTSEPWFLVTPEWNKKILGRIDDFVIESSDVKNLIVKVADWSITYDLPELPFRLHKFLFCEKRARDMPKADTAPCYSLWYAQGFAGRPGYIQFADADRIKIKGSSDPWFRLTAEWNHKLNRRVSSVADAQLMPWEKDYRPMGPPVEVIYNQRDFLDPIPNR